MKKLLCLLLAGLMCVSLIACGDSPDIPNDHTEHTEALSTPEVETEDPNYFCDLPSDLKFDNQTVNFLYSQNTSFSNEIYSEQLGGSLISDSVYERNLAVEDMLDIRFEFYASGNVIYDLTLDIQGGLGDYHIASNETYKTISSTVEGRFLNLRALDELDLSKHYWTQGYNDMMTFTERDMQFLASGSIALSMYRYAYMTLYNKSLFADNKLEDLYDTVMKGEWTLDQQYAISKNHYLDSDGDGAVSEGDFYGFVTGSWISVDAYPVASDIHLVIRDPDTGDLVFNAEALGKLSDLCDKTQLLYNDASTYVYSGASNDDTQTAPIIRHFIREKALMVTALFSHMEMNYGDLAALSYGIAPIPKFDQTQSRYYSYVQDQVSALGISSVVGDPADQEMCAAVLEAMAYHSHRLVRPAYYNTALSERYMQEPQSKEILDLIFNTLYFDFSSTCCNMLNVQPRDELRSLLTQSANTIASSTKSWEKAIQNSMTSINRRLNRIAEKQGQ